MIIKQNGKVSIGFVPKQIAKLTAKSTFSLDKDEYDITDMAEIKIMVANETDIDYFGRPLLMVANNKTDSTICYGLLNEPLYIYGGDSVEMSFNVPICSNAGFLEGMNKVMLAQNLGDNVIALNGMEPITIKVNRNADKLPNVEAENYELMVNDEPIMDFDDIQIAPDADLSFTSDIKCNANVTPQYCKMEVAAVLKLDEGTVLYNDGAHMIYSVADKLLIYTYFGDKFSSYKGKTGTFSIQYMPMFDTKPRYVQYNGKDLCFKFKVVDSTTGIKDVTSGNKASELMRFDVMGRRISAPAKGLNLIKMSDGSVKKVIVKLNFLK